MREVSAQPKDEAVVCRDADLRCGASDYEQHLGFRRDEREDVSRSVHVRVGGVGRDDEVGGAGDQLCISLRADARRKGAFLVVGGQLFVPSGEAGIASAPQIAPSVDGDERAHSAVHARGLPRDLRADVHADDAYAFGVHISQLRDHGDGSARQFRPDEPRRLPARRGDGVEVGETFRGLGVIKFLGIGGAGGVVVLGLPAQIVAETHHITRLHEGGGDVVIASGLVVGGEKDERGARVPPAGIVAYLRISAHSAARRLFRCEKNLGCDDVILFAGRKNRSLCPLFDGIHSFPYLRRREQAHFHTRNYTPKQRQSKAVKNRARGRAAVRPRPGERARLRAAAPAQTPPPSSASSRHRAAGNPYLHGMRGSPSECA